MTARGWASTLAFGRSRSLYGLCSYSLRSSSRTASFPLTAKLQRRVQSVRGSESSRSVVFPDTNLSSVQLTRDLPQVGGGVFLLLVILIIVDWVRALTVHELFVSHAPVVVNPCTPDLHSTTGLLDQ